jgi:hypothetical protein
VREAGGGVSVIDELCKRRDQLRQEAESMTWEYDVGLTDAPPRRPPIESCGLSVGDKVEWAGGVHTVTEVRHFGVIVDRERAYYIHRSHFHGGRARRVGLPPAQAFTPSEVEAILAHGSDRYASQAMVCDEARVEVAAVQQLVDEERWKREYLANGNDPATAWDFLGSEGGDGHEYAAQYREWKRDLPKPLPHETPGDWAARCGAAPPCYDRAAWAERVRLEMAAVERGEPCS